MHAKRSGPQATWTWETALRGVVPPVISPLTAGRAIDSDAVEALVAHLLGSGCSGLFVVGGCGEGPWLTTVQRSGIIRAMVSAARGRVPVLTGLMLPGTGPVIDAAHRAMDDGADALVVGSPYYYGVDAAAQRRHVEAVLTATALPILLYNIPQSTHQPLALQTVRALAADPRILGIKDSAGDMAYFQQLLAIKESCATFRVLQGGEQLASSSLLLGADGLVPGTGNVAPRLLVALHRAGIAGDAAESLRLQRQLGDLNTIYGMGGGVPGLKAACAALGIGNGLPATPHLPVSDEQRAAITAVVRRHVDIDTAVQRQPVGQPA